MAGHVVRQRKLHPVVHVPQIDRLSLCVADHVLSAELAVLPHDRLGQAQDRFADQHVHEHRVQLQRMPQYESVSPSAQVVGAGQHGIVETTVRDLAERVDFIPGQYPGDQGEAVPVELFQRILHHVVR